MGLEMDDGEEERWGALEWIRGDGVFDIVMVKGGGRLNESDRGREVFNS